MKCLCGYERITDYDKLEERKELVVDFKNGENPFKKSDHPIGINVPYSIGVEVKYLYACPKCGTVKIEL